jgi:SAM-dependent methyltransferase
MSISESGSYLSGNAGHLLASWKKHVPEIFAQQQVARETTIRVERARARIESAFDVKWNGETLLDVGAGQLLRQSLGFGVNNRVVAIDLELPFRGLLIPDFIGTAWRLGLHRASKTLARQLLGVDQRFRRALSSLYGVRNLREPELWRMSATQLEFRDEEFGGAFSFSTFQHIDRPEAAAREMSRVLRPGSCAYAELHLYSSLSGSDHPFLRTRPGAITPWGHLRRSSPFYGKTGLFVNRLRLHEWKSIFERSFDEVQYFNIAGERESAARRLTPAIQRELADYSEEELTTTTFIAVLRKCKRAASVGGASPSDRRLPRAGNPLAV